MKRIWIWIWVNSIWNLEYGASRIWGLGDLDLGEAYLDLGGAYLEFEI